MFGGRNLSARVKAAVVHLLCSAGVGVVAALLVFGVWYPDPFQHLAGGQELFFLIVSIDVIVGPLLTAVVFSDKKRRAELVRDVACVVLLQLGAFTYGVWTTWTARPLYLVAEFDRFKVVSRPMLEEGYQDKALAVGAPGIFEGPLTVWVNRPKDPQIRAKILFETLAGGRDYGERPEFFVPYTGDAVRGLLEAARPAMSFTNRYPERLAEVEALAKKGGIRVDEMRYVPIMARQLWVAMLNPSGAIVGYVRGDGF